MHMDERTRHLRDALGHMKAALDLIDESDEAQEVGAHLDLAISILHEKLESDLDSEPQTTGTTPIVQSEPRPSSGI